MLAYTRKFMILKREYSTLKGINPKGHCKLEIRGIRGVITVNIENAEADNFYNVILISKDKVNSIWNLGKIFTDNLGKGKGEYVITQRELEAKNISMDKISAILILREDSVLMGAYLEKEDGAIEGYIESMDLEPQRDTVEDVVLEEEAEIEAVEPVELVEPVEVIEVIEDDIEKEEEVIVEVEALVEIEEEPEEIQPEEVQYSEPIETDLETLDYMKKLNQKNQTTNYVLSILRFFPYIEPFKYELKGYNWWIVDLDSENEYRAFLPYFSYITGGNNKEPFTNATTCNQLMNKYGHYLFGLYNEEETVKYFLYGIPGEFNQDEHPYRGENGFNIWHQVIYVTGYWIIYIDPMTGRPVYPEIPMEPID